MCECVVFISICPVGVRMSQQCIDGRNCHFFQTPQESLVCACTHAYTDHEPPILPPVPATVLPPKGGCSETGCSQFTHVRNLFDLMVTCD